MKGFDMNSFLSRARLVCFDTVSTIASNLSMYIAVGGNGNGLSAGSPMGTIQAAINYLQDFLIVPGVTVTINVAAGYYFGQADINVAHVNGERIQIIGATGSSLSITGIASVTSVQNYGWSVVLNTSGNGNASINDYIIINQLNAAGGYNFFSLVGCHRITALGTNQITVSILTRAAAPSGSLTATAKLMKTILYQSGYNGIVAISNGINQKLGLLDWVVLAQGCGVAGTIYAGTGAGISGGIVTLGQNVGVSGFNYGVSCTDGGLINAPGTVSCGSGTAAFFVYGTSTVVASGGTLPAAGAGSQYGFLVRNTSNLSAVNAWAVGNLLNGFDIAFSSCLDASGCSAFGNMASGLSIVDASMAYIPGANIQYNTSYGIYAIMNVSVTVSGSDANVSNNTAGSIYAQYGAIVQDGSANVTPAANNAGTYSYVGA